MDQLPSGYIAGSCNQTPEEYIQAHQFYSVHRELLMLFASGLYTSVPPEQKQAVLEWREFFEKFYARHNDVANRNRQLTRQPDIREKPEFMAFCNETYQGLDDHRSAMVAFRAQHPEWCDAWDDFVRRAEGGPLHAKLMAHSRNFANQILANDLTVKKQHERALAERAAAVGE